MYMYQTRSKRDGYIAKMKKQNFCSRKFHEFLVSVAIKHYHSAKNVSFLIRQAWFPQ